MVARNLALFEQRIDQRGFAVIDVGDDGQVANVVVFVVFQAVSPRATSRIPSPATGKPRRAGPVPQPLRRWYYVP